MNCVKKLWHESIEIPKPKSNFILVQHFFGYTKVETAYMDEKCHYVSSSSQKYDWWNWAWKIDKWCYIEDLLKVKSYVDE